MTSVERKPCVLVVDDHEDLADVMRISLNVSGFEAHAVTSGQAALDWIAQRAPDVLVLDLMMPDVNGFAVLRQLRAQEHTQRLPVVVITAHGDYDNRMESQTSGADRFLVKPVDTHKLVETVRQAWRARDERDA